ncbi:predicted protein [Nematostella vectensis]|uniref:HMG box domain-containing protein n=1 Tax=Nematostella vectensis TaxID=45351 RepID=A7S799_NEMVE|nr:non-histone protein 10 isoform X2 [Nematostella vectensis]EDO40495.1 predicted protein [Nematostella vectensis]|eukprot:XP_001632558.1 predicted protein [Nematostella vectensis]
MADEQRNECEQENERIVNRIYHVRKLLKRFRRQRRFLMEKLDDHEDDYRSAQPPLQTELMAEIVAEGLPSSFLPFGMQGQTSPGQVSNATTSSHKKGKSRSSAKQDKEKDPNAPKKPANAFFMFCQQQRTVMQEDHKDATAVMGHHELTKSLAKEWNNLLPDEKKVYYEMYERDKERYELEMKQYSSDKPPSKKQKDPSSKKRKPKGKEGTAAPLHSEAVDSSGVAGDQRSSLLVSATLNPLFSQSLGSVSFGIPLIPSPTLPSTEKDSFQEYDQLSPPSQDSFLSG